MGASGFGCLKYCSYIHSMKNKVMMKVVLEQLGALVVTVVITVAVVAMAVGSAIISLG